MQAAPNFSSAAESRGPACAARRGTPNPVLLAGAALFLWAVSGLGSSPWSFLPDPELASDLLWLVVLGAALVRPAPPSVSLCVGALVVAELALASEFFRIVGSEILFGDDHSSFLYRLHLLRERFPHLATYDTTWNAGVLTSDLMATGAVLLFLVGSPLFAWLPLDRAYNLVVAGILLGFVPWSVYLASRLLGLGRRTALVAGVFGLAPSLLLFRWSLKYGATPFVLASSLAPVVYASAQRTLRGDPSGRAAPLLFAVALWGCMFWSGSIFLLAPVGLALVLERSSLRGRIRLASATAGALAASLWWLVDYVRVVPVATFLQYGTTTGAPPPAAHPWSWSGTLRSAWAVLQMTNPFLLVFAPVAWLSPTRGVATRLGALAGTYLAASVLGPQFARHLELDRMALPMSFFLAPVAALGIETAWREARSSVGARLGGGLAFAAVAVTLLASRGYLTNRSVERFSTAGPEIARLCEEIRSRTRGGRTYIAGFVLHDFAGGHAAALPYWTGVPMVAVEPIHRFWWYRDPLPLPYRREPGGLTRYLSLLNVDLVLAKDTSWRNRLAADPAFSLLWESGRYALFGFRDFPASWFLSGEGEVEASGGRLRARLRTPAAVLRFRWVEGLRAEPIGEVLRRDIGGLPWIELQAPLGQWVEIERR